MTGSDFSATATGAPATVEACSAAGREALARGDLAGARSWADRCVALAGGKEDARCAALEGAVAAESGDLAGAAAHLRRAARLAPDEPSIAQELAEVLEESGELEEAIEVLSGLAARAPDPALLMDLGYLRLEAGDTLGARAALEEASELQPGNPVVDRALARFYEAAGEADLAAETLARVARVAPDPGVLNDLARIYLWQERYPEASAAFRRLAAADPDQALFANHGETWCRIKAGDWRGALEAALNATRLDRYDLTTAFLAYARDRLFTHVPDAAEREAELGERFYAELAAHAELHGEE